MVRDLQPGDPRLIGPYRLLARLGSGGMGRVFLGLSPGGRLMAVKVIRADLAADPEFRVRFRREVASSQTVSGVYTAMVVDADLEAPEPWLATAYVTGPSLAEAVREHGPLPASSVLGLAAGLAESMTAIHSAGLVHRDLKPSNVLLAEDGPRVIDFGISRAAEATSLTRAGLVIGSPGFMSPEQAEGGEVGPPSDMFSLGAVLMFAATGEGPFGGGSTAALVYRVVHTPADTDHLPDAVRRLVEGCLAKDPGQRLTAADVLAEAGVAQPTTGWLPEALVGEFARHRAVAAAAAADLPVLVSSGSDQTPPGQPDTARTVTAGRLPQAARLADGQPSPGGRKPDRRSRLRHPLAVAVVTGTLLAAMAMVGFALSGAAPVPAGTPHPQAITPLTASPATATPASSALARQSRSLARSPNRTASPESASPQSQRTVTVQPSIAPRTSSAPPPTPAGPPGPRIVGVSTLQRGVLVYFDIHYADSDNDAAGFGFVGVNGSGWAEESHPFTSPSFGIVGPDSIEYPFNEACGTAQQYDSYVQAWIYDSGGVRSKPVIVHLACTA